MWDEALMLFWTMQKHFLKHVSMQHGYTFRHYMFEIHPKGYIYKVEAVCHNRKWLSLHPGLMTSQAGLVCPLCDSASWPVLSSRVPSGLRRPVHLLKLCTQGLGIAAAVSLGNFTALPEGPPVFGANLLVPCGCQSDDLTDAALSYLYRIKRGHFLVADIG